MEKAQLNGVELEYQVTGSGEPVLLISTGPVADCFQPLLSEPALVEDYSLITYHQRGQVGSGGRGVPASIAEHAADAAALLKHLSVERAHVTGQSTGADIALQLAHDHPDIVHTLILMEPALMVVPSAPDFFESIGPALAAYHEGDRERAVSEFMTVVCSLDWETWQSVIGHHIPGGVEQTMKDADTFFESFLPALGAWQFGATEAAAISQPILSVLGTDSHQLFVDGRSLLHSWFPRITDCTIENAAHLLQLQQPGDVAREIALFLARYPLSDNHFGGLRTAASSNAAISL